MARRKSGKTAFVQRLFNQIWSANAGVIRFYLDIGDSKWYYPNFAIHYYSTFATQYISFRERDESLATRLLPLDEISAYGRSSGAQLLVTDVDYLLKNKEERLYDSVWHTAYTAPHRMAATYDQRVLVMLDEFQNITQSIYRDEACKTAPDEDMAGSFHSPSESKYAPMLVTGSYVGWLLKIMGKYLEAVRLTQITSRLS